MTLQARTFSGVVWNSLQRFGSAGINFLVTFVLAHILAPADFGLLAMMAVFIAIANTVMDSGFRQALIRKPGAEADDYKTAFYANIVLGLLAYLLLFVCAPLIARFYNELRLTNLIRVAGLIVLVNSTTVVQVAILSRRLDFKAQLLATVPAVAVSGAAAVALAYAGWGVWALIAQMVIAATVTAASYWMMRVWRADGRFSARSFREMYGFGSKLFGASLIETIFQNMYVLVIAKLFAATIAGQYFLANKIKDLLIQQVVGAIQTVTYPALATFHSDDAKLKAGFRQVVQMTTFVLFPVLLTTAALAEPLFRAFLPDTWLPAAPYLQLLCLAALLYPLHVINLNILKVKGRSDLFFCLDILKKAIAGAVLFVTYRLGVIGILLGQIGCSVLGYYINSYFSSRLVHYPVVEQICDFLPELLLAIGSATVAYAATQAVAWPAVVKVSVFGALSLAVYVGISFKLNLQAIQLALGVCARLKLGGPKK